MQPGQSVDSENQQQITSNTEEFASPSIQPSFGTKQGLAEYVPPGPRKKYKQVFGLLAFALCTFCLSPRVFGGFIYDLFGSIDPYLAFVLFPIFFGLIGLLILRHFDFDIYRAVLIAFSVNFQLAFILINNGNYPNVPVLLFIAALVAFLVILNGTFVVVTKKYLNIALTTILTVVLAICTVLAINYLMSSIQQSNANETFTKDFSDKTYDVYLPTYTRDKMKYNHSHFSLDKKEFHIHFYNQESLKPDLEIGESGLKPDLEIGFSEKTPELDPPTLCSIRDYQGDSSPDRSTTPTDRIFSVCKSVGTTKNGLNVYHYIKDESHDYYFVIIGNTVAAIYINLASPISYPEDDTEEAVKILQSLRLVDANELISKNKPETSK